jgi:uncharacterized protein
MTLKSREFQVFVKPAGARCNLQCSYCYYLDKQKLHSGNDIRIMPDDLLKKYVIQHVLATTDDVIFFSWHGGEPMLAGIDFYRKATEFQKKYLPEGKKIINGIQTNGTLIDEEWSAFFAEHEFAVGISIDGPGNLHNENRTYAGKKHSLENVLRSHRLLQENGINPEILCVVNSTNAKYPLVCYDFFKDLGVEYLTFLPLVERINNSSEEVSDRSVAASEFGNFLTTIFDEWVSKDIGRIKVQIFEEAVRTAFNQEHTLCIFKERCGGVPVVEMNGDFYSCDHFVDNEHLLGNINEQSLSFFLDHPDQQEFGNKKQTSLPGYCLKCDVLKMCNGECPKNRFILSPDGEPGLNYLCSGYKHFFNHCKHFVEAVAYFSPGPEDIRTSSGEFKSS